MSTNLKQKIQNYLTITGATILSMERKAGMQPGSITNILRDASKNPSISTVIKIADALDISLDELLDRHKFIVTKPKIEYSPKYMTQLFKESCNFIIEYFENTNDQALASKLKLSQIIECLEEIYKYCIENELPRLDTKFARWLLNKKIKELS